MQKEFATTIANLQEELFKDTKLSKSFSVTLTPNETISHQGYLLSFRLEPPESFPYLYKGVFNGFMIPQPFEVSKKPPPPRG